MSAGSSGTQPALQLIDYGNAPDATSVRGNLSAAAAALATLAREYQAQQRPANTRAAYEVDWNHFARWCNLHGLSALPADVETLTYYLAFYAKTLKANTLERRLITITSRHRAAGLEPATSAVAVKATLAGIRRQQIELGTSTILRRTPIMMDDMHLIMAAMPETLIGKRDRAMLAIGWAAARRSSEIADLNVEDVHFVPAGMVINIRRSKTDQDGHGELIGIKTAEEENIPICAVRAYREWIEAASIKTGAIFRLVDQHGNLYEKRISRKAVYITVKRSIERLGIDSSMFGGHSLRAGLMTQGAVAGAPEWQLASQSGHKHMPTVRIYIRRGSLFQGNLLARIGY